MQMELLNSDAIFNSARHNSRFDFRAVPDDQALEVALEVAEALFAMPRLVDAEDWMVSKNTAKVAWIGMHLCVAMDLIEHGSTGCANVCGDVFQTGAPSVFPSR